MRWHRHRRLQHQLFAWLALTIVATVVVVALALRVFEPSEFPFAVRLRQLSGFASAQFAERWHDVAARERLARQVAESFDATLWLADAGGAAPYRAGPGDCHGPTHGITVRAPGGAPLGEVSVCLRAARRLHASSALFVLGAAALVLWTAAALVARRITRPLSLLIDATREIGAGNLAARVRLGRHQKGELGTLAESVNDMAQRIERQLRDQRELLAVVSHEVRSPLTRLRLCAELLRANAADATALSALEREVDDLDVLVGKLLANSRLDFEVLTKARVSGRDLFTRVLGRRRLDPALLDDQSSGAEAELDATLVARALDNLLDNAVRHGGGVRRCVLRRTVAPDGRALLCFEVWDEGAGFDAAALPRVFDAFFRGRGTPREAGQLGLGLALVRRISRAHGGDAWAENLSTGGARVGFSVLCAT